MTNKPIGFYKENGKTRPISADSGKRRSHSARPTKLRSIGKTGTYADLHDVLVASGYSYDRKTGTREQGNQIHYYKNKQGDVVAMTQIAKGATARNVNIPISDNMTLTRIHGGPDTYKIKSTRTPKTISAARIAELKADPQRQAETGIFISDNYGRPFKLRKKGDYLHAVDLTTGHKAATMNLRTGRHFGATDYFTPLFRAREEWKAGND